jgi:hypothetical protein
MNFENKPLFIVASERSGTNLLRRRLTDRQSLYVGPPAAHFLKHLYYQEPYFGDLALDSNFLAFLGHALELVTVHFAPWQIDWTTEGLLKEFGSQRRSAIAVMDFMMAKYARQLGYSQYICKDNHLYEFALDISGHLPGAKFIYLHRDPRDFVLSQMARPGAVQSVLRFARLWAYEQTKSIKVHEVLARDGRSIRVGYEDFIRDEEVVTSRLMDFIGVDSAVGGNAADDAVVEEVHEWKNLSGGTLRQNYNKYLDSMSPRKIRLVNGVCRRQMEYLGYLREGEEFSQSSKWTLLADYTLGYARAVLKRKSQPISESHRVRGKVIGRLGVNYRSDI